MKEWIPPIYPKDFTPFRGKILEREEVQGMINRLVERWNKGEFYVFARTGDTLIVLTLGYMKIYRFECETPLPADIAEKVAEIESGEI